MIPSARRLISQRGHSCKTSEADPGTGLRGFLLS